MNAPSKLPYATLGRRAQFSPVLSTARQRMLARNRRDLLAATRSPALGAASPSALGFAETDFASVGAWWNPRLLDQLTEPLSRIRE